MDFRRHLEGFQIEFHGAAVEHAEHDALAELCGKRGDTEVDDLVADLALDSAILGNPSLGDVQVGHDLDAGGHRKRQMPWRRLHLVERTVDAVTDLELLLERFEVNVARLGLNGAVQDQVDIADDRSGVGFRGSSSSVEFLLCVVDCRDFSFPELLEDILHGGLLAAVVFGDQFLDLMTGGHHLNDLAVERVAEVVKGLGVEGVAECHRKDVAGGRDGNDLVETSHARGDEMKQRGEGLEGGEINSLHSQIHRQRLGESLLRHDSLLDHDVVDRTSGVDRLGEEFLGGEFAHRSGTPEDLDDLMRIHGVSGCLPWWRK